MTSHFYVRMILPKPEGYVRCDMFLASVEYAERAAYFLRIYYCAD